PVRNLMSLLIIVLVSLPFGVLAQDPKQEDEKKDDSKEKKEEGLPLKTDKKIELLPTKARGCQSTSRAMAGLSSLTFFAISIRFRLAVERPTESSEACPSRVSLNSHPTARRLFLSAIAAERKTCGSRMSMDPIRSLSPRAATLHFYRLHGPPMETT